ncbi:mitochondrial ubiquitin ligase activator of nfkb 1-A [Nerophis lumbriciformis]|uniref:mitochondrial ubiquitin ligase activator of nfkb 1-A n=1 Tax=Nerophis lumbriciformis TaxID=546530 RepID=UPI002ADF303E|nr:mitochondrial ubiquitin ligase activator of nfkb 1-A-like [Nerophis lumbriciformis]
MSDFISALVLFGAGTSFACSGLFHHLYHEKKKELKKLKEIPVFRPDQRLSAVLKSSPRRRLHYVAVEGVVQADEEPLSSHFVPKCFGVLRRTVVQEHSEFWNTLTKTWRPLLVNRRETNNAVPFSLVCPGSYMADFEVKVQDPLAGSGYFLEQVHYRVRQAEEGLVNAVLRGIGGERSVAIEESEEMLRVGSSLTVFGEVLLEEDHGRMQAPQDGRQYLLVPSSYESYMERHERAASMWKMLTAATGITGASLLAAVVYNMVGRRDERSK